MAGTRQVGQISSAAWSPDFRTNAAIGMIRMSHWDDGTQVTVECPDGNREARVRERFFI
jgi:dimethylsulfoniopropionate demethylase